MGDSPAASFIGLRTSGNFAQLNPLCTRFELPEWSTLPTKRCAKRVLLAQAQSRSTSSNVGPGKKFYESLSISPPKLISNAAPANLVTAAGVVAAICVLLYVRGHLRRSCNEVGGSVSDLIRRGQIRSDRKPDSRPLKYEDPFNNPLVRVGKKNPIVRMCGKIFRLAPVTLTEEKVLSHQNRRIQAYQWRRPVVFLNEGDPVPEGVDPEEVRWIPTNHPFATTKDYIDEDLAQKNVYQTRGVPSRVRAEHEALRKKMKEATENVPFPESGSNHSAPNSEDQDSQSPEKA